MSRMETLGNRGSMTPEEANRLKEVAVREQAAQLAHQLGNLLQVVNGNLELLAQRITDEAALPYLANARAAADQLTELTRALPVDPPE
jgi:nitrogen-specific signal transduction histidine kinase